MVDGLLVRDAEPGDAAAIDRIAAAAFAEFEGAFDDWPAMARGFARLSALHDRGELLVAERTGVIRGAVLYGPPFAAKAAFFAPEWPILRMLAVDPQARSAGVGRALVSACVRRARRDGAEALALHSSPIMPAALGLYRSFGFERAAGLPAIHGVPYDLYLKKLEV